LSLAEVRESAFHSMTGCLGSKADEAGDLTPNVSG
jgi:hypothetical protein